MQRCFEGVSAPTNNSLQLSEALARPGPPVTTALWPPAGANPPPPFLATNDQKPGAHPPPQHFCDSLRTMPPLFPPTGNFLAVPSQRPGQPQQRHFGGGLPNNAAILPPHGHASAMTTNNFHSFLTPSITTLQTYTYNYANPVLFHWQGGQVNKGSHLGSVVPCHPATDPTAIYPPAPGLAPPSISALQQQPVLPTSSTIHTLPNGDRHFVRVNRKTGEETTLVVPQDALCQFRTADLESISKPLKTKFEKTINGLLKPRNGFNAELNKLVLELVRLNQDLADSPGGKELIFKAAIEYRNLFPHTKSRRARDKERKALKPYEERMRSASMPASLPRMDSVMGARSPATFFEAASSSLLSFAGGSPYSFIGSINGLPMLSAEFDRSTKLEATDADGTLALFDNNFTPAASSTLTSSSLPAPSEWSRGSTATLGFSDSAHHYNNTLLAARRMSAPTLFGDINRLHMQQELSSMVNIGVETGNVNRLWSLELSLLRQQQSNLAASTAANGPTGSRSFPLASSSGASSDLQAPSVHNMQHSWDSRYP